MQVIAVGSNTVLAAVVIVAYTASVVVVAVAPCCYMWAMLAVTAVAVTAVGCMHPSVRQVPSARTIVRQQRGHGQQSSRGCNLRCTEVVHIDHAPDTRVVEYNRK